LNLVIDASVTLKWFLLHHHDEQDLDKAGALAMAAEEGKVHLFAPLHWRLEVLGVLSRNAPSVVEEALLELSGLNAKTIDTHSVYLAAATMAADLKQHMFDTMYHAVAISCSATLVTADEAYFTKARALGHISLLSNFELK
jgi:predicted nucleic acid-binding protein